MAFRIQTKIFAGGMELHFHSLSTSHGKSVPSLIIVLISTRSIHFKW